MSYLPYLCINGQILKTSEATIPASTEGILNGEGIFTTLTVKQKVALFLDKHIDRLQTDLQALGFTVPKSFKTLEEDLDTLITKLGVAECGVRITILNDENPVMVIHAFQLPQNEKQINVITLNDTRDEFRNHKTTNRLVNLHALKKAKAQNAQDALFVQDDKLIESTYTALFSINRKGTLITPRLDGNGLESITKQVISEQIEVRETDITKDTEGPLVLVTSLRTMSVKNLDGRRLRDAGKIYERILKIRESAETDYIKNHQT